MAPSATPDSTSQLALTPPVKTLPPTVSDDLNIAYKQLESAFILSNPKSQVIYDEATKSMPGGNTRTVLFYQPYPLSIIRAEGSRLYDADGHEYVDVLGEFF